MALATSATPSFAARLAVMALDDRLAALKAVHPDHQTYHESWEVLLHAFEGAGGFHDGNYLWPYARESEDAFIKRKAMARYHNYVETLVDLYVRYIFTQGVKRTSKNPEYNAWAEDVDGAGTDLNEFLKRFAAMSLVTGHAGMLVDKTADEPVGPTRAEERARVVASIFAAPSIADWRFERNKLVAVKLYEAAPEPTLDKTLDDGDESRQYLLWDLEGWARFNSKGDQISADVLGMNVVPLIILRPKPSQCSRMLGRALIGNSNIVRALFNRAAEEDEVIRAQAFSVMTVEVPPEGNVDEVKGAIGGVIGTAKALIAKGKIEWKTPSQDVPLSIRDNMSYLVQELYRNAHVRWRREGGHAESGESIRLQYAELNEMLQAFSSSLREAEMRMARLWFAWNSTSPQEAQTAYEAAEVNAEYPDEFFLDSLINDLQAWGEAIALNLGQTMTRRIKKRAARRVEPDMPPEDQDKVDKEIDAQKDDELNPGLALTLAGVKAASDTGDGPGDVARESGGDE